MSEPKEKNAQIAVRGKMRTRHPPYPTLGDPVVFFQRHFQRQWWVSTIQSYAQLRLALKGEGLHQHHLIPRALFLNGPKRTQGLIDYIPSVPFTEDEHLNTLHSTLNDFLRSRALAKAPVEIGT